ncbi:bis(5'-nucleosyl)-tetraphosphatase (symmetrical) YqeK [Rossellomorea aquimaris]|uniref:bis(5'-nucleosyl)-tetraphosphatase (symmetrical) YqeK n=1 Tax=Rossellomorea aquimaris TaxID=189382 RepID=UPI001CD34C7E|nr:bis(5'-nucleosyl)-tetraphosphatase (symmetrical) YqeK [Rossellomorea aquimaris]MCA1056217.1 bis(5'-nucleosyl)-tetraphosphatase (symmetrical) YqeK [Rossellomorea aquimaris]
MDRQKALELVKEQLTDHRYIHTCGVMETAILLARRFGADEKKAEIAAIFHDYAKFRDKEEMKRMIESEALPKDLLEYNGELWHAPVGAILVEREVGIDDAEILNAIRYHTSGCEDMSTLDKVIYLADYIEPNRSFPGVEEVREMARESLDKAIIKALQNTVGFLMKKGQPIYPDTFKFYNQLVLEQRR